MQPKYLWFRVTIFFGLGLGLLLLVQTVLTYRHVTNGLLRQEAQREIDRRVQSINRAARLTGSRDPARLAPVLQEMVHEAPKEIAWIRIINGQSKVLAATEMIMEAPAYPPGTLGRGPGRDGPPGPHGTEKMTPAGPVWIALSPLRLGPPPFERPPERPSPEFAEIAVFLNGVSTNFGLLREYLVVGCLAAIALMAAVIVLGLRFPHYMRGKRVEEELALARRVQLDLFPGEDLSGGLPFAAKCVPAWQVGGDLYDVFETDDGEVALVLGDVSGKGLPAALLMGVVQGAVRASTGFGAAGNHEHAAERLNQLLCMKTAQERFVSLFWCYFDRDRSVLRYINAGHQPPLLIREKELIRLDEGGPVLGLLPGARYTQAEIQIQPGDLLIVYSDGILEAENAAGAEFGEAGVIAAVTRRLNQSPAEICTAVLSEVGVFLGTTPPQDDQTLLIARLTANSGSAHPHQESVQRDRLLNIAAK